MEELARKIYLFNREDQHFKCIAHILNLGAQDMLKELNRLPKDSFLFDELDEGEEDDDMENSIIKIKKAVSKNQKKQTNGCKI